MMHVFYADRLFATYEPKDYPRRAIEMGAEVYNGGYVYQPKDKRWYRCDLTPVLIEDVPKTLRTWVLLML